MELERISVALRPRTPREAIDLGATMLRAHAKAIWLPWFVFSIVPALVCIGLATWTRQGWLGLLLLWWLLPLFDRVPLFVLSRAVFERVPGWRETLRGQRRMPWGGTWASLTWRRLLDTQRSLRLPLELLEGLTRQQRGPRWRVLSRQVGGSASLLSVGCLQLTLVLFASVFMLGALLLPPELVGNPIEFLLQHDARGHEPSRWTQGLLVLVGYAAVSMMEPWHVAAGFGLYLNRRTQLEAWDIDLAFRRLRQRLGQGASTLLVLLACGLAALSMPTTANAAATAQPVALQDVFAPVPPRDLRDFDHAANQALQDPRFGHPLRRVEWVLRKQKDAPPPKPSPSRLDAGKGISVVDNLVAGGVNVVLWSLLAIAIAFVLWFVLRYVRPVRPGKREPLRPVAARARADVVVVSAPALPDDLASATRRLWQGGQHREAMSLLYRGSVTQLAEALQESLPDDATEAECLRRARRLDDETQRTRAMAIVRAWQLAAYADRYPSDGDMDRLLTGWPAQARGRP